MLPMLILGICVLVGFVLLANWFVNAEPKTVLRVGKYAGMGLIVLIIVVLALTGRLGSALAALFFIAPVLLRWRAMTNRQRAAQGPSRGQRSALDTRFLHVELAHDSGEMTGWVTRGRFEGRELEELTLAELLALLADCEAEDAQSAAILEAFLDRRHGPEWRDAAARGGQAGGRQAGGGARPGGADGPMTEAEAYQILGLEPGASPTEIKDAHRRLMKRFHPDQGGSDYLAAKLNQAKEVLLKR